MAKDEARTTMTANNAEMIRAYQQIEGKVDSLGKKMEGMGQKAAKGAKEGDTGILKMAAGVDLLGRGWGIAERALSMYTDANRKMLQDADKAALTLDDLRRNLLVTAGMTPEQGKGLVSAVESAAGVAAVPHEEAYAGARAMLKKKFTTGEVKKGLADFLTGARAISGEAGGKNEAEMAMALGGRTNMRGALAAGRTLTKGIDLGGSDLESLLDSLGAPKKGMAAGLKELSVDPLRVNAIGESAVEAFAHIQAAIERVDKAVAQVAVGKMVGVDKVDEFMEMFSRAPALAGGKVRGIEGDLETLRTGDAARRRRATGEEEVALATKGTSAETIGKQLRTSDMNAGKSDWHVALRQMHYEFLTAMKLNPKDAAFAAIGPGWNLSDEDITKKRREVLGDTPEGKAFEKSLNSNTAATKALEAATKDLAATIRGGGAHHIAPQRPKAKPVQGATK